jgi:cleavage and polyadenylation specificity factor subunit 2
MENLLGRVGRNNLGQLKHFNFIYRQEDYFLIDNIYEKEVVEKSYNRKQSMEIEDALPTKCISHLQKFDIQCSIVFIDFEGRSDGESIQKLLEHVNYKSIPNL